MTDVLDRTDDRSAPQKDARTRLKIIDCDIHPSLHSSNDLNAFLSTLARAPEDVRLAHP